MKFTGEQVVPGEVDPDLFNEHRARYLFAQQFSPGKKVLDAACGTGYGSALLGEKATVVFGVDISPEAIRYARQHYPEPKLHFGRCDCLALPFPSGWFDLVVAFEIIEHLEKPEAFLTELRRVLHPSGLLLLSTPNRLYYTEERGEVNPFHCCEFSFPELQQLLSSLFPHCAILFENHVPGLLISEGDGRQPSSSFAGAVVVEDATGASATPERAKEAHYFVAMCSNRRLEPTTPLLYLPSTGNILRERELHIRRLKEYLVEAKHDWEKLSLHAEQREKELNLQIEEIAQWTRQLDQQLNEKNAYVLQLQADYDAKVQWASSLLEDLEQAQNALQKLQQEFEERTAWALQLEHAVEERTAWAKNLDQDLQQARAIIQKLQHELEERTAWALRLETELKDRRADLQLLYGSLWYRMGKKLRFSPVPPSDWK
ncbi:MAG: methyltransferase domain-containing protein [Acidobacteria bacterium]|nr:methyltransferase domain-containing protein [Acidobacteriota bacterium]